MAIFFIQDGEQVKIYDDFEVGEKTDDELATRADGREFIEKTNAKHFVQFTKLSPDVRQFALDHKDYAGLDKLIHIALNYPANSDAEIDDHASYVGVYDLVRAE